MSDFIEVIPIANKRYYFSFRKNDTEKGIKFFVLTLEGNDSISFEMEQREMGKWKIINRVPHWIKEVESKLSEAINDART